MKKKLTQAQQDILALAIQQGGYAIDRTTFHEVAALVVGGHLTPDNPAFDTMAPNMPVHVHATSKGLRAALAAKAIVQDGIRFYLTKDSPLWERLKELRAEPLSTFPPSTLTGPPLRLVAPKPRDPFDEGFTAGRAGQPENNTWTDAADASMYDEGHKQGVLWRQQHPAVSA